MHDDVVTPTLAYAEAREICIDIAALFAGSTFELVLPPASLISGSNPCVFYDERMRVQLVMRLPSLPTILPGPGSAFGNVNILDEASSLSIPPLLSTLLSYLHISLRGTIPSGETNATDAPLTSLFVHSWQRLPTPTDFGIRRSALSRVPKLDVPDIEPLRDASFVPGISYDLEKKVWVVRWWSDVSIPYTTTDASINTIQVDAVMQLRLELARLSAEAHAPPPQMPFHYAANNMHPFSYSDDPYLIDVDLLSDLADKVKVLNESPKQRLDDLSKRLTMLPLSMLAPGSLGTNITSPWSESQRISEKQKQFYEQEAAARASDADIALAPLSQSTAPASTLREFQRRASTPSVPLAKESHHDFDAPQTVDLATLASYGPVALTKVTSQKASVCASIIVRMRTLSRSWPTDENTRAVMVCVELEALPMPSPFLLHAIHIDIGERSDLVRELGFMPYQDTIEAVMKPLPGDASTLPVRIGRFSQHNLLYTVHLVLREPLTGSQALGHLLTTWDPRRCARVTLLGTPDRGPLTAPHSTCVSQWNGSIDLSLALLDLQRRSFAEHVMHTSMRIPPLPPAREERVWTVGDPAMSSNALYQGRRVLPVRLEETSAFSPHHERRPQEAGTPRRALGWNESNAQNGGFDPTSVDTFDSCLLTTLEAKHVTKSSDAHYIHVYVTLTNVSSDRAMDLEVSWFSEPNDTALVPETDRVRLGILQPGMSRRADLCLHVLCAGFHRLGHVRVCDIGTNVACILHHAGSMYVAFHDSKA